MARGWSSQWRRASCSPSASVTFAVGPIAIVATGGPAAEQARAFAGQAQLLRPIRIFAEQHEARQWLDRQPYEVVDPRAISGDAPLPPIKLD